MTRPRSIFVFRSRTAFGAQAAGRRQLEHTGSRNSRTGLTRTAVHCADRPKLPFTTAMIAQKLIRSALGLFAFPALSGCVASTLANVVTAPVKVASSAVDLATTSQSEADEKRGRELRKRE